MPDNPDLDRSDNFFGQLKTETCSCGHRINVTNNAEHTCDQDCACGSCRAIIVRQLQVIEED